MKPIFALNYTKNRVKLPNLDLRARILMFLHICVPHGADAHTGANQFEKRYFAPRTLYTSMFSLSEIRPRAGALTSTREISQRARAFRLLVSKNGSTG